MNRGGNLSKSKSSFARDKANPGIKNTTQTINIDGIQGVTLVGAGALDVARLLAAVAHALSRSLLGAVAGKMSDLAA